MHRDEVLAILREHKPLMAERFGIVALALFGSTARGDASAGSDVDLLVRPVDLMTDKALRAELRPWVEREAIHV